MSTRRPRERPIKSGTGRTSRAPPRNAVAQNASPPTTSLKSLHGVYANQHFVHMASVSRGCVAELQVKSGKKFEGILNTFSPLGDVELQEVHAVDPQNSSAIPSPSEITEKVVYKASSIVCINIKDVDMDFAHRGADAFQTDAEIARKQNGQIMERDLEVWEDGNTISDYGDDPLSSGNSNGWSAEDMFRKNEQMGVTSSYDSALPEYTTPLDMKDTEENHRKIQWAEKMAQKIEGSTDYRHRVSKELETSEDEKFSAVSRPSGHSSSSSPASASSSAESLNTGRYVPPALRNRQGGEGHNRNIPRGATPPGLSLPPAGRARAQSPHTQHMHPSHPSPGSPHGMASPQQRVQTPPHSQPAVRSPHMNPQQQAPHGVGSTPRSPPGIPQAHQPLPQRGPPTGRRTAAEVVQGGGSVRPPVQSVGPVVAAPFAATADSKQSNVDKSRDGAGPQDVEKKTQAETPQAQRGAPTGEKSPSSGISDSSKRQTIEQFREFQENFMLQEKEKAGPSSAATTSLPQSATSAPSNPQQIQQLQQPAQPTQTAAATPTQTATTPSVAQAAAAPPPQVSASPTPATEVANSPSTTAAPAVTIATTTSATSAATTPTSASKTAEKAATPPTTSSSESKKEEAMKSVVAKSTLNPNAKEFNPMAKTFRIQPQKTPTPPRPPSQPSPAQVMPTPFSHPMNPPIYPVQHYPPSIRAHNQRKGGSNIPQLRGQGDIHPILPVSMAAGQPLVTHLPHMQLYAPHPGPSGPITTQTGSGSHVLAQQQHIPYLYQAKQIPPRIPNQQNIVAAGQHPGSSQHQMSQDAPVMVFPTFTAGINNFAGAQNIPISQTPSQMPTPYHQFNQQQQQQQQLPQPQPQPQHHQNPTVHLQPHQAAAAAAAAQAQVHHQASHPHGHQHTTPPQAPHTPQGQAQTGVMQQPQQPGHGGRPSPSPVNQVMHQASSQQQHQQQPQQATYHPQGIMPAIGQPQPQNHQMMAAMAAVNQQGGAAGSPHTANNHSQQQNMLSQMHPHTHHVIHQPYSQGPQQVANITNVTPVHSTPHPHPKPVFLHSSQGQHAGPGGQQGLQAIPMHNPQPSIMSSPVQGPYMQTPPGQLQQPQVQQYQPSN
ncbi:uncharacterized protein [Diadema antillarum]|uniref:uncharacterized protein n=1 Tax=Diadema antillarum TaxID=105358 RepID=UPI003A86C203